MSNRNSMLIWYPKTKDLPIPQPKTEIILLTEKELEPLYHEEVPSSVVDKVKNVCEKFGYPCFLRTDLASAKHSWKKSCFIDGKKELWKHIYEVTSFNLIAGILGLDFKALVVRQYIPMDTKSSEFWGDMPVNPERRYFINDRKVLCHHPYWINEAIEESKPPSVSNWREIAKEMNTETEDETKLLMAYAKLVAERFDGYWSIDFCKAKDGRWLLIDMALGSDSWHPDCEHKLGKGDVS